jgi:hypothetical protein
MNPDPTATPTESAAESVQSYAQNVAGEVRQRAERAISDSDHYVRENPWPVVIGAAGIGLLIGYALAQRHEPTLRERYLDDPLDHARDVLAALLGPVATRLGDHYDHARSAVESAAEDVDTRKLVKQASRLGKKLRFW